VIFHTPDGYVPTPGRAEFSPYIRLPHVGQKWRVLVLPLSAREAYDVFWPLMTISSFRKRASDMWPVPDAR
jgi:hypothetical protein